MVTITKEVFFEELSQAIFNDLKTKLLNKQANHCLRVDYLPKSVMEFTCQKLNQDDELRTKSIESYILTDKKINHFEIESGRLIELRNRLSFGVLVVFIPQGFKGAAEDSYDIHTFEAYDLAGVLISHKNSIISSFTTEEQHIIKAVMDNSSTRKQRIENQLYYLLSLKNDGCTWETAGAYLYHLNLIPDLRLSETDVQARLLRNGDCIERLSEADKTIFLAIDSLINKGLDPEYNSIKTNLLEFFRLENKFNIRDWTERILTDKDWLKKLSFDKWKFKDLAGEQIEVFLESLRSKDGIPLANNGFELEGDNLIAKSSGKIKIRWKTNPRKAAKVSQFVIVLEREEQMDASSELLRKTANGTTEQANFSFRDVELEQGEEWLVQIRIVALDENKAKIAEDITEPFYLRGENSETSSGEIKRFTKIRNHAEAIFRSTYRFKKEVKIDSESLETGRILMYRIKTKPKEIYQIPLNNLLYDLELKTLQDPYSGGAYEVDILNRGFIERGDFKEVKLVHDFFITEYNAFMSARRELFHAITSYDSSAVIETLDLRKFSEYILDYAQKYQNLTSVLSNSIKNSTDAEVNNLLSNSCLLNRLDTIHIKLGSVDEPEEMLLLAPTHPLKMLWLLQYQILLLDWSKKMLDVKDADLPRAIDIEGFEKILPLNIPNAISYQQNKIFVNTDLLDLFWSIFPKSDSKDIRKIVATLTRALGYKDDLGNISSVSSSQIADRLWRYLRHHPYIKTLKLNVLNPGDGMLFLNTIREIQKIEEYKDLRYDITFYGTLGYELMGSAFDDLMSDNVPTEGIRSEIDEELLEPSHNPLFPKLFFSKVKIEYNKWSDIIFKEANVTVLIDQFLTKTISRPVGDVPGCFFLHGLLAEYRSEFNIMNNAVTWSRKVVPSRTSAITSDSEVNELLYKMSSDYLGLCCSFFDWGKSTNHLPTIQLELDNQDRHILSQIHENSDWVFTIDRNFGIEYFDNPADSNSYLKSYLIDYTPEFMDGVGHRLIVSTGWVNEIEKLIEDGLNKIKIPTSSFRAVKILDIIKSVSGKLALKLINNPNNAKEIIGLAITRLALEKNGQLSDAVLIPVDTHIDLFIQNKKRNSDQDISVKRSDLILVSVKDRKLNLNLVEVKFRTGEGNITENLALKEEIVKKNDNSEKAFRTKFVSDDINPKIDIQLTNKSLSTLIGFYLERAIRHRLCISSSELSELLESINSGDFEINFEKTGYIYHWAGISKPDENYKGNRIFEYGNKEISDLLEIRSTEIDDISYNEQTNLSVPESMAFDNTIENDNKNEPIIDKLINKNLYNNTDLQVAMCCKEPTEPSYVNKGPHIVLGSNTDNGQEVIFDPISTIPKKLTNQHLLIVGKSGAGKSQTTSSLLHELNKQLIPFLILDFQGEYASTTLHDSKGNSFSKSTNAPEFDPSYGMNVNPLELSINSNTGEKISFMNNVYQVSGILKQIFSLGDIQHSTLKDAIKRVYHEKGFSVQNRDTWENEPPLFMDIWTMLEFMEANEGSNVKNLKYRIEPLFENNIFISGDCSLSISSILKQNSVINLSTLHTPELMKSVARFLLQAIYNRMLTEGPSDKIKLYVVIDEAHKLSYDQTLTDLIREARKYGIGFILASQSVRDFANVVFDNIGTKIALQLDGEDAKFMADNFGVIDKNTKEAVLKYLPVQKPMRALIRNNHYEPFVQVDIVPFHLK